MLDSLDRIQIYSPAYVSDQNGVTDRDAVVPTESHISVLRVTAHGSNPLKTGLKSSLFPSRIVGLG